VTAAAFASQQKPGQFPVPYSRNVAAVTGFFSIADCMYAPVVSRFRTYGIETPAVISAYMDRMSALPAMQDWAKASQAEVDAGLA
jgi:glutathione S-transferase